MIELGTVGKDVRASAEPDGWWLKTGVAGADLAARTGWPIDALRAAGGVSAALQVEALIQLELAEARNGAVFVPWERFGELLVSDAPTLPLIWTDFSPLRLVIRSSSELGRPDFEYEYEFSLGGKTVPVDRDGYFIRRRVSGDIFHLDRETYSIVAAVDEFNVLSGDQKQERCWSTFAAVRGRLDVTDAAVDSYLTSNTVITPAQITATARAEEANGPVFVPTSPDLPPNFPDAFLRNSDIPSAYSLDGLDGQRIRVVFTDRQRDVLKRMQETSTLRGEERERARTDPSACFDGLLDAVEVTYGPRVIGVGDFTPRSTPAKPGPTGRFLEMPSSSPEDVPSAPAGQSKSSEIVLPGGDMGGDVRLAFRNDAELAAARIAMQAAVSHGDSAIDINGRSVTASEEALRALSRRPTPLDEGSDHDPSGRKFLLVYTNETETLAADQHAAREASKPVSWPAAARLPQAKGSDVSLKPHQLDGIKWLACCQSQTPHRRGVLLADDMGLGKTRQILMHLANRIEDGLLQPPNARDSQSAPWRPILIVAPLMLVEDETWQREMKECFAHGGEIFEPLLCLHGQRIDRVRAEGIHGRETIIGRPILDPVKLMGYRTVITSYETLVSYQHSFAQLHQGRPLWSVMVTDEAQRYKVPNTKVSHAVKAVAADFRIASTGTPVENRLLDLWNITDALQPALLGDEREFSKRWEQRVANDGTTEALAALRERLLFGQPNAFLIRRSKKELTGLPPKLEEILTCEMSPAEVQTHRDLVAALGANRRAGSHLAVLQRLAAFYQHPAILRGDSATLSPTQLLAESAKLRAVVAKLREVRARGEKALIFARLLDVQQILAQVCEHEFKVPVPIINGTTSQSRGFHGSTASTVRAKDARRQVLKDFRERQGFALLILSPHVAGIGLTITEANHVFHYGRWWNPAVEAQATDRAYRIGQTRPVTVYLPILKDPSGVVTATFDERLQELMIRKTNLAQDFLQPSSDEDSNAEALCDLLASDHAGSSAGSNSVLTSKDVDSLDPHDFEALLAALYTAEGYAVVLTAKSGDGGADVVAVRGGEAILIQAKHSARGNLADETALNDLVGASDIYPSKLGRAVRWRAVLALNGAVHRQLAREAGRLGVAVLSGPDLLGRLKKESIGRGAIASAAAERCASFTEGIQRARAFLSSP